MYREHSRLFWALRRFTAFHPNWFPDCVVNYFIDREWQHTEETD